MVTNKITKLPAASYAKQEILGIDKNLAAVAHLEVEGGARPPGHDLGALVERHVVGVRVAQLVALPLLGRWAGLGRGSRAGLGGGGAPARRAPAARGAPSSSSSWHPQSLVSILQGRERWRGSAGYRKYTKTRAHLGL